MRPEDKSRVHQECLDMACVASQTSVDSAFGDYRSALEDIWCIRRQLDRVESIVVRTAIAEGLTWEEVGEGLHVSRQAVHKRYATAVPAPESDTEAAV